MADEKKKYVVLTLAAKAKLIDEVRTNGMSRTKAGEIFGVDRRTVTNILAKEKEIKAKIEEGVNPETKRSMNSEFSVKLDARVAEWFRLARGRNVPVTGGMLQKRAKLAAEHLGNTTFAASNGWLESFKKRHNITCHGLSGVSNEMENTVEESGLVVVRNLLTDYDLKDVFNCDETGLFWRGLPTHTLAADAVECKGGMLANERITILFTASAKGEKLKPFVIGTSFLPRCFNNATPIGIDWKANKKAWMNGSLFQEYLVNLNHSMLSQNNRKILLLMDNAPCHSIAELSNVKIVFLPAKAGTQPLDAGIIKNFKHHYRTALVQYLSHEIECGNSSLARDFVKSVTISDAVRWTLQSWAKVEPETIRNCFRMCGIYREDDEDEEAPAQEIPSIVSVLPPDCQVELMDEDMDEDIEVPVFATADGWEAEILTPPDDIVVDTPLLEVPAGDGDEAGDEPSSPAAPHHEIMSAYYFLVRECQRKLDPQRWHDRVLPCFTAIEEELMLMHHVSKKAKTW